MELLINSIINNINVASQAGRMKQKYMNKQMKLTAKHSPHLYKTETTVTDYIETLVRLNTYNLRGSKQSECPAHAKWKK